MSAEEIQLEIAHRLLIDIIGSSERFFSSTVSRNSLHFTSNSPRKMAQSRAGDWAWHQRVTWASPLATLTIPLPRVEGKEPRSRCATTLKTVPTSARARRQFSQNADRHAADPSKDAI